MIEISLKNKVAVITGGTSGIGLEIVKTFLKADADVIFIINTYWNFIVSFNNKISIYTTAWFLF